MSFNLKTNSFTTMITLVTHKDKYGSKVYSLVGEEERESFIKLLKDKSFTTNGFAEYVKGGTIVSLKVSDNLCSDNYFNFILEQ